MNAGLLHDLLEAGRRDRVYSAAAWAVGDARQLIDRGMIGTRAWPTDDHRVDTSPLDGTERFDLASLTKPMVAIAIFSLIERGRLDLGETVGRLLPRYAGTPVASIRVADLLLHTSGLPGRVPLFRRAPTREAILDAVAQLPQLTTPGTRVEYSSQGFILLGLIAEEAAAVDLATIIDDLVAAPAGAGSLGYIADPTEAGPTVATEHCAWRQRIVQGEVHDENAVVLGRIAGHAGLFGTLDDVIAIGRALAHNAGERVFLAPSTFQVMTTGRTHGLNLARSYGWQGIDHPDPTAGCLLGRNSYGHTGFTGTSIFVEPDRGRWYALLTNRVHPSRSGPEITGIRRRFHNIASMLE